MSPRAGGRESGTAPRVRTHAAERKAQGWADQVSTSGESDAALPLLKALVRPSHAPPPLATSQLVPADHPSDDFSDQTEITSLGWRLGATETVAQRGVMGLQPAEAAPDFDDVT